MTTPRIERLRQPITETARDLERAADRASELTGPPAAGDLFVFDTGEDAAIEWLVVREHADDPSLLLLAPGDDFPLVGPPDVELPRDLVGRLLTVRCGESLWVPVGFCQERLRTGLVPVETLRLVRRKISELARGRADASEEHRQTDADPEYEDWLGLVARSRERLQQMADQVPINLGVIIPFEQLTSLTVSLKDAGVISLHDSLPRAEMDHHGVHQYAMAAAPELEELLEAAVPKELRGVELSHPWPGRLILVPEGTTVGVRYLSLAGEEAPFLAQVQTDGQSAAISWKHTPDRKVYWAIVGPTAGRAVLRLSKGAETHEVIVET